GEQLKIVDDRERRRERSNEILFAKGINAVFDADTGIRLAQRSSRDANVPDAAMRRGRRETNHIEQRPAADGYDIRMPVDVMPVDVRLDFRDVKVGIFGALAAFDHQWPADEFQ